MSRKHYEMTAAAIAAARSENEHGPDDSYGVTIAENLADAFALDNPRFDRVRFLLACGYSRAALGSWGVLEESA